MLTRRSAFPVAAALTLFLTVALVAPAVAADRSATVHGTADDGDASCAEATPPNTTVAVMAAPPNVAAENWSASRIQATYRCDEAVRSAEEIAFGDTLVVRLRAPGLADAVAEQDGATTPERFRALVASDDANLTAPQLGGTVSPERAPLNVELLNGTRVLHAYGDTFYVVADTTDLWATVDEDDDSAYTREVYAGQGYRLRLEHDGHAANDTVLFTRPEVRFSVLNAEDRLYRAPAPGQTFSGPTTLAAGQNVTLTVSDAATGETVATARGETTLNRSDDRRFEATADLSSVDPGADLAVTVRSEDGRALAEDVSLRLTEANATVELLAADGSGEYGFVEVEGYLSRGGFLALHAGGPDGPVLDSEGFYAGGAADAQLQFENVPEAYRGNDTAELTVVAYRDSDGDGTFDPDADQAYGGSGAEATTTVEVDTDDGTTTTARGGATTADGETTTGSGTTTDDESAGGDLPGFGVAAALVALITGLVALALRR